MELGALQCRIISENLASLEKDAVIIRSDVLRALKRIKKEGRTFDIVFADPPYEQGLSQKTIHTVCDNCILSESGVMAVTTRSSEELPQKAGSCEMVLEKRYGDTKLALYKKVSHG